MQLVGIRIDGRLAILGRQGQVHIARNVAHEKADKPETRQGHEELSSDSRCNESLKCHKGFYPLERSWDVTSLLSA